MITPDGRECRYYYSDFHRGRSREECRLLMESRQGNLWHPADCRRCPVPDILWANASPHLRLSLSLHKGLFGLGRSIRVIATCRKHKVPVENPFTGCPLCVQDGPDIDAILGRDGEQ